MSCLPASRCKRWGGVIVAVVRLSWDTAGPPPPEHAACAPACAPADSGVLQTRVCSMQLSLCLCFRTLTCVPTAERELPGPWKPRQRRHLRAECHRPAARAARRPDGVHAGPDPHDAGRWGTHLGSMPCACAVPPPWPVQRQAGVTRGHVCTVNEVRMPAAAQRAPPRRAPPG